MTLDQWLALVALVVGVPLNLFVTVRLWRLSRANPRIRVLRERALVALVVLLVVALFSVLFRNNDLAIPFLDPETTKLAGRGAILALAILPASYWLFLYRHT